MKRILRLLLPLLVLLAGIGISAALIATGPETSRKQPVPAIPVVEALTLEPQDYAVRIPSSGTISPLTQSNLAAEVSGRIVWMAESFRDGGVFAAGDELVHIDPRDYENARTIARAELTRKRLALAEEEARSARAREDWKQLGYQGEPAPLTLRQPQLENARAELAAAEASLRQAELELERTKISAPYAGRILARKVGPGQFVSSGTPLADIYAADAVEVRLPVNGEQLQFLELPEVGAGQGAAVDILVREGRQVSHWNGRLVRSEGSVDVRSRQLFVIARIEKPYEVIGGRPPLRIGQFVEARIHGRELKDVFVLPRRAVSGEKTIYLIDAENRLQRQELNILWRDEERIVANGNLAPGAKVSLTTLAFAAEGIRVRIAGEESPTEPPVEKESSR